MKAFPEERPATAPSMPEAPIAEWLAPSSSEPSVRAGMETDTLCDLALNGDMSAWNALVQKHNHRVVVSLLARGVRMDRAKDLAQDAWIRLIEQQREGRLSHLQLPGLAVAQAGFLALEAARRAKRTDPVDVEPHEATLADPRADAESQMLTEERLARAEEILATCAPSARQVFRLVYGGEGLSHAEVAERVGLSLQRVRQIVCEVRKLLRAAVEGGT